MKLKLFEIVVYLEPPWYHCTRKCPRHGNKLARIQCAPKSTTPIFHGSSATVGERAGILPIRGTTPQTDNVEVSSVTLQQLQYESDQFRELATFQVHVVKNALQRANCRCRPSTAPGRRPPSAVHFPSADIPKPIYNEIGGEVTSSALQVPPC